MNLAVGKSRDLLVECWEWCLTPYQDVPDVLRLLAGRLEQTGDALLSVVVTAEDTFQALVDTQRGSVPVEPDSGVSGGER